MSDQIAEQLEKSGVKYSKEKLLELIRKSNMKEFHISKNLNSKTIMVSVPL